MTVSLLQSSEIRLGRAVRLPCGEAGFHLFELAISLALFALIVLNAVGTLLGSNALARETEMQRIAREAAENQIELLRATPFPAVAAAAQGRVFSVPDLHDTSGSTNQGKVTVFLSEGDPDSPAQPSSRSGFDLDGNGITNDVLAVTDKYRVLPIRVEVTWNSGSGPQTYEVDAILTSADDFLRQDG